MIMIMALMSFTYTIASENNFIDNTNDNKKIEVVKVDMPAKIKLYSGDSVQVHIRAINSYLQKSIHYDIDENKKLLNIWIDGINTEDIYNINSNDIRISIVIPNEVDIKTNSNLLVASSIYKKKTTTDYGNN